MILTNSEKGYFSSKIENMNITIKFARKVYFWFKAAKPHYPGIKFHLDYLIVFLDQLHPNGLFLVNLTCYSTLRLWVGYFINFKFTSVFFFKECFSSVKEINTLLKEKNGLLSKGMLNIYLSYYWEKVT